MSDENPGAGGALLGGLMLVLTGYVLITDPPAKKWEGSTVQPFVKTALGGATLAAGTFAVLAAASELRA